MGQKIRRRHMRHKTYARANRGSGRSRYLLAWCDAEAGDISTSTTYPGQDPAASTAVYSVNTTPDPDTFILDGGTESHGLADGDGPFYLSSTGDLPDPFTASTPYFAFVVDANEIQFSTNWRQPHKFTIAQDTGSGTRTLARGNDQQAVFHLLRKNDVSPTDIEAATLAEAL